MLFMTLALLLTKISSTMPPQTADISNYNPGIIFYANNIPNEPLLSSYESALLGPYGLGIQCVRSPEKCSMKTIPSGSLVAKSNSVDSNKCTCPDDELICEGNATAEPPNAEMSSGHRLFNMTGLDLNNWLIGTEFNYSYKRIGGITFGLVSPLTGVSIADFFSLFEEEKLVDAWIKFVVNGTFEPKEFESAVLAAVNSTSGQEVFKDKNPADNIVVWFNGRSHMASMTLMNGVTNLILRASLPKGTDPSDYSIKLIVDPLPLASDPSADDGTATVMRKLYLVICIIISLSLTGGLFVIYLVDEKVRGVRHLINIAGVNRCVYWLTNFIWDFAIMTVTVALLLFLFFIFNVTYFIQGNALLLCIITFFSYAFSSIIFVYLMSLLFKTPSSAFVFISIWASILGVFSIMAYFFFYTLLSEQNIKIVNYALMIIPHYCLGRLLINLAVAGNLFMEYPFQWEITGQYIVFLLCDGLGFLVILLLIEYRNVQPVRMITMGFENCKKCCSRSSNNTEEDDGVTAEKERVLSGEAKENGDMLIINSLTKYYCQQRDPAVNHIFVGVKSGECFGLLGMNGAGKSTVFNMITGSIMPTSGDAIIGGMSIISKPTRSRLLIGYCPQNSALDPYLTPVEHFTFFCRIRGVPKEKSDKDISSMIERMRLTKHKDKISKTLSGGNQRKVNVIIALLGEPELVLLDEPTAGMDLLARRYLWSLLQDVLQDGRSIVLTTHSMEECQALSTQISVMLKGRFRCFGSSQNLKSKFNEGYSVTVRAVNLDGVDNVIDFFRENLPGSKFVESHNLQMKFKLHPDTTPGKAVAALGKAKKKELIDEFSINQTTLENIFLKLASDYDRENSYKPPWWRSKSKF